MTFPQKTRLLVSRNTKAFSVSSVTYADECQAEKSGGAGGQASASNEAGLILSDY